MPTENDDARSPAAKFLQRRDIWIRWVIESDLKHSTKIVGVHLAMRMNAKKQECWPNIQTMERSVQITGRQIQRCVNELEEFGALDVRRFRGKGNYYSLKLPSD